MTNVQDNVDKTGDVIDLIDAKDRRGRIDQTVDELLSERQQVLVVYSQLIGLGKEPMPNQATKLDAQLLRAFCQVLVDYIALGHFEIYQRIIEGDERRQVVVDVAKEVYPAVAESTDLLVDFNDKYDDYEVDSDEQALLQDLSKLGEVLAIRAELEDKILVALKNA